MAEKIDDYHILQKRVAAPGGYQHDQISHYNTQALECVRNNCPAPKTYGDVFASGESNVQLGDVYIFNIGTASAGLPPQIETAPYWPYLGIVTKTFIAATEIQRVQRSLLPWLLTVTYDQIDINSERQHESRHYLQIDMLRRWRLYLGVVTGRNLGVRIHQPRIQNVVQDSAPIMLASRQGDLMTIRRLLMDKPADLLGITIDNLSPLFHAIDNCHSHITKELLNAGVDPNQTFGENQTSPLQWAVLRRDEVTIRLLIEHGASLQHVSLLGRSVTSYLWISEENVRPTCIELMHLLRTADPAEFRYSHQVLTDVYKYSTLNRAACMGTHDELEFLLRDGADTKSVIELEWDAMFNATYQGNLQNVKVLSPYFPGFAKRRDLRGWTLLHVAAEVGHLDIIRYLLENGSDWQARSWPSHEYMREILQGKTCTPAQVAAAESFEREQQFLEVVDEVLGQTRGP